jgi:Flp pilus assembly protein TadG
MVQVKKSNDRERGAALVELAICATVFLTVLFGVIEFGRALWVHNALSDAARRGARFAINNPADSTDSVKNVVVFGDAAGGTKPLVDHLSIDNVEVQYSNFRLGRGTVTVSIRNYDFNLTIPLVGRKIQMPAYSTTLTGENVGLIPPNI